LPFLSHNTVLRVFSASSFLLLGYSLLQLYSLLERDYNPAVLLTVVFLNPLIWTFGGRGTADLFPAALTLFATTLLWQPKSSPLRLATAISAYGIAIALKYHAALLLPLVGLEIVTRPGADIRKALLRCSFIVALILVIPVAYVLFAKQLYGFWFVPPAFRAKHGANLSLISILTNMIGYTGYLSLLLFPYSLSAVWERANTTRKALIVLVATTAIFVAGFYGVGLGEEMRFGPLDAYVNPRIYSGAFLVFAVMFIILLKDTLLNATAASGHRYISCMLIGIVIFVAILSFTRPAQRYLLFVLPLSYFFVMTKSRSGRYITGATVLVYGLLISFITLSQVASGSVARNMVRQITERGLLEDTEAGYIMGNVGNQFPDQVNEAKHKRYTVIAGISPKALFTVESHPAPLVRKVLSLVPYEDAPVTNPESR